mmetsp:Transcript_20319/g.47751  ORF Transcript_20319/g.47751 Transcript_20319/m.47751 type:complete len:328 (+) Transcript_20319:341-1324(+)
MISIDATEMTRISESMEVTEGLLFDGGCFDSKVFHGKNLPFFFLVPVFFCCHFWEDVSAPQLGHVFVEGHKRLETQCLSHQHVILFGNMHDLFVLLGKIQNELPEFLVGVVRWTKTVNGATLELPGGIGDAGDSLRNIGGPNGLGEHRTVSEDRNHLVHFRHVGKIMEEFVLRSKELGGTNNRRPRIYFTDSLLSEPLGAGPFGGMVFGHTESRYVNEVVNLHLEAQFRNLFRDPYIDILEGKIGLPTNEREFFGLNRLAGCMGFRDEIDHNVGVTDDLPHGIHVFRGVENKSGVSQIEHGFDVSVFVLVTAVADVRVCAIVTELMT